jgi:hypothetical protein
MDKNYYEELEEKIKKIESDRKFKEYVRKLEEKEKIVNTIIGIICSPLYIFFSVLYYVVKLVSMISSLGIFVGLYKIYESISIHGLSLFVIISKEFRAGIFYIIFPFIAFLISYAIENVSDYCRNKSLY